MMADLVVVPAEGGYLAGAGVLFNSLHRRGFRGIMIVAGRGGRPSWWPDTPHGEIPGGGRLEWLELPAASFVTRWKPWAMQEALKRFGDAERWFLMDADLVAKAPWSWFQHWADCGVAVVRDLFADGSLPADHPWRRRWSTWLAAHSMPVMRSGGIYANSGFIAGCREHATVLDRWEQLLVELGRAGVPLDRLRIDPDDPRRWDDPGASFVDQDALNLALMTGDEPLAPMEAAAMDLGSGGEILSHAVNMEKPWEMRPWTHAWRGTPPAEAQRWYWREAHGVLPVWSEAEIARRQADLAKAYAWTRWPLGLKVAPAAILGWWRERRAAGRDA